MDAKDVLPGVYPVMYSNESSTGHGTSERNKPVHGIAIVKGDAPFLEVKVYNLARMLGYNDVQAAHITHDSTLRIDAWGERWDLNTWPLF